MQRRHFLRALVALPLAPLALRPRVPAKTLTRVHDSILFNGPWKSHEIHQVLHAEMLKMAEGAKHYHQMFVPRREAKSGAIAASTNIGTVSSDSLEPLGNVKKTA